MKRKVTVVLLALVAALLLGLSVFFVACDVGTESGGQNTEQGGTDEEQGDGNEGETGGETGEEGGDEGEMGEEEQTPSHTHTMTYIAAEEATCTEEGNVAYWYCSGCGKNFSDEAGENELTSVTVPAKNHSFGEWVDNEDGETHTRTCSACTATETEDHVYEGTICKVCGYENPSTTGLTYELTGEYYTVTGIDESAAETEIVIPLTYQKIPVCAIAPYAFWGNTSITSIEIPGRIISVGNNAFQYCTALSSVTIDDDATGFGTGVFLNCTNISEATVPASAISLLPKDNLQTLTVTSGTIAADALAECTRLISLTAPTVGELGEIFGENKSVLQSLTLTDCTEIAPSAFADFTALSEIVLPETITSIGAGAITNTAYYNNGANWLFNVCYVGQYLFAASAEITGYYPITAGTRVIADETFRNCTLLTGISLPDSLVTIGASAFRDCSGLTSELIIPDSVISIGDYAFYMCSGLTGELTLPNSLENIGDYAFYTCSGLTGISLPDSLVTIGASAFRDCSGLTSELIIPDSVISIGDDAFYMCSGLTGELTLPNSLENIGDYAFYMCSGLTGEFTLPNSLENIGDYVFYRCSGLTGELTIPASMVSIGWNAFNGCSSLTKVTIEEGLKSIDSSAFSGCSDLTEIIIPASVTSIGYYAFHDCSSLTGVYISNLAAWWAIEFGDSYANPLCYSGNLYLNGELVTELVVPEGVTSIGSFAFYRCDSLTKLTIPAGVKSIGHEAFYWCRNLTEINYNAAAVADLTSSSNVFGSVESNSDGITVTFGDSVTSIPAYLFESANITSVTIGSNVESIGSSAFRDCTNLKEINYNAVAVADLTNTSNVFYNAGSRSDGITVTFGESVKSIPAYLFYAYYDYDYYSANIVNMTIGSNVESIGSSAFCGCSSLTEINYNAAAVADLTSSSRVFYGAGSNSDGIAVTFGESVKSIPAHLFYTSSSSPNLVSVTIGSNVESIGSYAFRGCSNLASVTIGEGVTSIGDEAFYWCRNLTEINYNAAAVADLTSNSDVFYNAGSNSGGITVVFGESVTSIPAYLFYTRSSSYVPNLVSVTIGSNVKSIGKYAFSNCNKLTSASFENTEGWWCSTDVTATSGTAIASGELADPSTAATYLKSRYYTYYWYRS